MWKKLILACNIVLFAESKFEFNETKYQFCYDVVTRLESFIKRYGHNDKNSKLYQHLTSLVLRYSKIKQLPFLLTKMTFVQEILIH